MTRAREGSACLDVVAAAYRLDLAAAEWLDGLLSAASPGLDHGLGVMAWSLRLEGGRHTFTSRIAKTANMTPGIREEAARIAHELTPAEVAVAYTSPRTIETASAALRETFSGSFEEHPIFAGVRPFGAADCMAARASDPSGHGFVFAMPTRRVQPPSAELEPRWRRVITHVLAGLRLRSGLSIEEGDAVLEPGGRLLHAEADARSASTREALRSAATTIDRARAARGRADPDAALARWKGLVAGRWSLVDRFDTDGRRFLIARRNDPDVDGPPRLSERERQVVGYAAMGYSNQHIAYALGLAPSTISTHLRRAMRHLGVTRRADLAALRVPPPRSPT